MQLDKETVTELDLSVVIITFNEEKNILACLRSLPKGAEVVVLDSGSSDATKEISERQGAHVIERPFTNYADQKNFAVSAACRRWVLSIDADERLTPELAASIARIVRSGNQRCCAYRLRRQLHFMGRPMRFGRTVDWPARLFLRGHGEFRACIHERFELSDPSAQIGDLDGNLMHYSYDDLSDYFDTFNRFTSLVAQNHLANGKPNPSLPRHVLRPWFEFVSRYFFKLGFLDGYPGYTYALLSSFYTYVKYAKLRELSAGKAE